MDSSLDYNSNKGFRLLNIYERLNKGEILDKTMLAESFGVTRKTIQRDIDDLRAYLSETYCFENEIAIKYDKVKNGYFLVRLEREWLTNEEVLALCKILLESRAFCKEELKLLIRKLTRQIVYSDQKNVENIISNEYCNYVPLKHNKMLINLIWELSQSIIKNKIISFIYMRQDGVKNDRLVKPVAIMFSEYYFYLIAYFADDSKEYPTTFRIDRISNLISTQEKFDIPYRKRFNDGEFRKRVQFMYSGELRIVVFKYKGPSLEAVLDRLPTAEVINEEAGVYTLKAEAYGDGIEMWLRSQGDKIEVVNNHISTY